MIELRSGNREIDPVELSIGSATAGRCHPPAQPADVRADGSSVASMGLRLARSDRPHGRTPGYPGSGSGKPPAAGGASPDTSPMLTL